MTESRSRDYVPPCVDECPIHLNIPRYIRSISEGRFAEALAVIEEKLPFPSVCGEICTHPCEKACNANKLIDKGPIAICSLKRFVAELSSEEKDLSPIENTTGKRVAIVGAGPAGLTAAYYLKRIGHSVTVLEKEAEVGGLLRYGIPEYRLNRSMLGKEIRRISQTGIEILTQQEVESPSTLLDEGYDAVFVAVGAHRSRKMGIPGEDMPKVLDGLSVIKELNSGKRISLGKEVIVIGGGHTAIDVARCALRLGSHVKVYYRRSREEMPVNAEEISAAETEGVIFEYLAAPVRMETDGEGVRLQFIRTTLETVQGQSRLFPRPVPGTEFNVEADCVISAVGQVPALPDKFDLACTAEGLIQVDREALSTNQPGVFAGGDAVSGPASFIEAVAAGRQAAVSIDRYLGGQGPLDIQVAFQDSAIWQKEFQGIPVGDRVPMPSIDVESRRKDFAQVALGFNQEQALKEAGRCLKCDLPIQVDARKCTGCMTCVMRCSLRIQMAFNPRASKIQVIPCSHGEINEIFFQQTCDECGICARHCPHGALFRGQIAVQ